MKNLAKRGLSLLLVLVMCLSLLPAIQAPAEAAVQNVTYVTGSTSEYSNYSNIIKNWGKRGETATFLSQNAAAFYTGDNTYANFSAMDGATSTSSVPSSELYLALKDFMVSNHTSITSYGATRDLFAFTDCENGGLTTSSISCFYSAEAIGPAWDEGSTWNREHTWPKSKCIEEKANDGSDIMMLRPTKSSINSSRGNTAFGKSSGYYDPSKNLTNYDVRGDVARIVLYNYVRWGNTGNMWGTSGVIESKEVLLDWMEADPVDTWELGRNDSVESITGTRNVFVDYPELAFDLFNETVPAGYSTPSGTVDSSTSGSFNVTFLQNGLTKDTSVSPVTLPDHYGTVPSGYEFEGWVTYAITNNPTSKPTVYEAGSTFSPTADTTLHALYSVTTSSDVSTWVLVTNTSQLVADAKLVIVSNAKSTAAGNISSNYMSSVTGVQFNSNKTEITTLPAGAVPLTLGGTSGSWTLTNASGQQLGATANKKLAWNKGTKTWSISISSNNATIQNTNSAFGRFLYNANSPRFTTYTSNTTSAMLLPQLYMEQVSTSTTYTTSTCTHVNTIQKAEEPAKCEDPGRAAGVWCNDCESYIEGGNILAPSGHDYEAVVTPPTTTAKGYTTYTCANGCGDSYVANYVDALSYTVSFSVPAGVTKPTDVHCNSTAFNLPTPVGTPLGEHEYSFVGWAEAAVDNSEEAPTLLSGKYSANKSITLYAIYSYTVGSSGNGFQLVTDASQLTIGASVIIAAKDSNVALSTTQNKNNRGQAAVTKDKTNNTLSPSTSVAILTLEAGTAAGSYAFNTGSGYLYAASSSKNYLRTETKLSENSSWDITIDATTYSATVKAKGTNSHNVMQYNKTSSLFACYDSASQQAIHLYIRTGNAGTTYYTSDIDLGAVEDGTLKFKGVNLTLKDSQYMNFNALQSVVDQYENVYAVLEADGKQIAVVTDPFTHTDADGNVRCNYSFRELNILDFGLEVKATLYGTKDGKLYCSPTVSYSLLKYCNTAIDNGTADAVPCAYLLKYVQAAEAYKNVAADDRITASNKLDAALDSTLEAKAPATNASLNNGEAITFTAQALDMGTRVAMLYKMDFSNFTGDTADVTITVSYTDIEGAAATKNYSFADLTATGATGIYQLSFAELYATQMSEDITCSIYVEGELESAYQNSIEHYCAKAQGSAEGDLALQIFRFGEAAKAAYAS